MQDLSKMIKWQYQKWYKKGPSNRHMDKIMDLVRLEEDSWTDLQGKVDAQSPNSMSLLPQNLILGP